MYTGGGVMSILHRIGHGLTTNERKVYFISGQDFPDSGTSKKGGRNKLIRPLLPKNYIKINKIEPRWGKSYVPP